MIPLDYNAGAPLREDALQAFLVANREVPANPSSQHRLGRQAQGVLEDARDRVAAALGCAPREIFFCATATEACNLALLGAARAKRAMTGETPLLVGSLAEHPAVLGALRMLQQEGFSLQLLPLDGHARVEEAALAEIPAGAFLAMQWANNETGAVQPWELVAELDCAFSHCDAVQGVAKLPLDPAILAASTLAISGHKLGAPKGVAVLRVADSATLEPVLGGGGQQRGIRPGTEAPALAAAFAVALEGALADQAKFAETTAAAVATLEDHLFRAIPEVRFIHPGTGQTRLPNTTSLCFPGLDGRVLLPALDADGLAVSAGSACSSGSTMPSSVLVACGLSEAEARATVRISFGPGQGGAVGEQVARQVVTVVGRAYGIANQ